jgi:hypothetical protein
VLLTRLLRHLPMSAASGAAASGDALAPCSTTAVSP